MVCVTFAEVFLDHQFILLLVPPTNHKVVLGTDEPVELLKPSHTHTHTHTHSHTVDGMEDGPVCLSGLLDLGNG